MANERMNELLLLLKIIDIIGNNYEVEKGIRVITSNSSSRNKYNLDKLEARVLTLVDEFMKPYAI